MLIICPNCNQKMKGPASNVGSTARCPKCARSFVVRPPHPTPVAKPAEPAIIEGVPIGDANWVTDVAPGTGQAAPSRRDQSASILDDMAEGHLPSDPNLKESHDWYVVVSDFEMDGPFAGREIVTAIRMGKLGPETRLQRGQTRTTVAELTRRLKDKGHAKEKTTSQQ